MVGAIRKRTCAYCGQTRNRQEMTPVTSSLKKRQYWYKKLGKEFKENCQNTKSPHICTDHFPNTGLAGCRIDNYPEKDQTPPSRGEIEEDGDIEEAREDSEAESEGEDHSLDSEEDDPSYECSFEKRFEYKPIRNIFCNWNLLVPHISRCYTCLKMGTEQSAKMTVKLMGAAVQAYFQCQNCLHDWMWCSSDTLDRVGKPGQKQYEINVDLAVAVLTTGNGFKKIESLCDVLEAPFMSNRRYNKMIESTISPAVEKTFQNQKSIVFETMKRKVEEQGGVAISGDGQWDSRGYSAMVHRFSLMEVSTKLLLDFEVCRKDRGGSSGQLEAIAHSTCFPRLLQDLQTTTLSQNPVKSFTSDRCTSLAVTMRNYPTIVHHFDSWHWIRSIRRDVGEKINQVQFEPMKPWIRPFIAHIHTSIANANGDGDIAYQRIMSFFHHICNKHRNFSNIENVVFDKINTCDHSLSTPSSSSGIHLDLTRKEHKKAHDVLFKIMTKQNRQRDLQSVSPLFTTSSLESFHSLANNYLPKENFLLVFQPIHLLSSSYSDEKGYTLRSKMACLHWNELQFDELAGLREACTRISMYCKTKKKLVWRTRKTRPINKWRFDVLRYTKEAILVGCLSDEDDEDEYENEVEARAAAEALMYAL